MTEMTEKEHEVESLKTGVKEADAILAKEGPFMVTIEGQGFMPGNQFKLQVDIGTKLARPILQHARNLLAIELAEMEKVVAESS